MSFHFVLVSVLVSQVIFLLTKLFLISYGKIGLLRLLFQRPPPPHQQLPLPPLLPLLPHRHPQPISMIIRQMEEEEKVVVVKTIFILFLLIPINRRLDARLSPLSFICLSSVFHLSRLALFWRYSLGSLVSLSL